MTFEKGMDNQGGMELQSGQQPMSWSSGGSSFEVSYWPEGEDQHRCCTLQLCHVWS